MGSSLIDFEGPIAYAKGIDLDAEGDTPFTPVPNGYRGFIVTKIVLTNVSADISAESLEYGLFDDVGGAGNVILASGVNGADTMTGGAFFISPAPGQTDVIASEQLYFNVSVAAGVAATGDCYVYGIVLP